MNRVERIKNLINTLNTASTAYYTSTPIMSDYEWDKLYDELKQLEQETGMIFNNSPTQNVGYVVLDKLKEVTHNHPMLSLDKTKKLEDLISFISNNHCVVSVKCDGLSLSLHYINGKLVSGETRGNGINGLDVLSNVLTINNIPKEIPYKEDLIIDGEVIIDWEMFRKINQDLPDKDKYKHPRNLVAGSLTMLSSKEAQSRNMRFIAWRVIKGFSNNSVYLDLKEAESNGFEIVPMWEYSNDSSDLYNTDKSQYILENIEKLQYMLENVRLVADEKNIPYDGAVVAVDDYKLAESMGRTDKFYKHSMAYKFDDELYETRLIDIEWNTSRTGLINPVAVFEPVDLGGAITTRATLHNIDYIKNLQLGIGDRIRIYRANQVIPKVYDNVDRTGTCKIPDICPICGESTIITKTKDSSVLTCSNDNCKGKLLGKLTHYVSKNAMNIEGLSEATLEKFIKLGWLNSIEDIYLLENYSNEMKKLDGFGNKSVNKLLTAIENSKVTDLSSFIYSLSIPLVGKTVSKEIARYCNYDFTIFNTITSLEGENAYSHIEGIGDNISASIFHYWNKHCKDVINIAYNLKFTKPDDKTVNNKLNGKIFVITGSLHKLSNRDEAKQRIEDCGGIVAGSISKKTNFLVCNEVSTSSKYKKAQELGVPIITEDDLLEML